MLPIFEDHLFAQGYFVTQEDAPGMDRAESAVAALASLWHYARIRITACPELADAHMLEVAQRNLGFNVPDSFYRGFPDSVRNMPPVLRIADQLLHYLHTYCQGDFSRAGHSVFEARYERIAFAEHVQPKEFAVITPEEAAKVLKRTAEGFLSSTRPLSAGNQDMLEAFISENPEFVVERCACKDTAIRIILNTGDLGFIRFIELSDVIRLVEWLHEMRYQETKLVYSEFHRGLSILEYAPVSQMKKLNLRNRDRKRIIATIDRLFECGRVDIDTCLEKKRLWNGLLHHVHYRPKCTLAQEFCEAIRSKDRRSAYSAMERCLAAGDVRGATDVLVRTKGPGAVLRHLDYLLSRIDSTRNARQVDADVDYVLAACSSRNRLILVQLLFKYGVLSFEDYNQRAREFAFIHLGLLTKHRETDEEVARRRSLLPRERAERVATWVHERLNQICHASLDKVYVADYMHNIAVPLQEGASIDGFGTLPRGTRIPLPEGKKVRVFTYWEKVNDIDLSCLALSDRGPTSEFSWRTMATEESNTLLFSGDETSGYEGGSEYFDVDLAAFAKAYGDIHRYLVFCNNVYSSKTFDQCVCRAGYMLRDFMDSGEVYEPSTVQTSFVVDCTSRAAYLLALDLMDPAIILLNIGEHSMRNIAGEGDITFLLKYIRTTDVFNMRDFTIMLARTVVGTPGEADVVFADASAEELGLNENQELIRPNNTARLLELLNAR